MRRVCVLRVLTCVLVLYGAAMCFSLSQIRTIEKNENTARGGAISSVVRVILSQEATTLARTKPVREAPRVLNDPAPILLVHQPSTEGHVPRVVPDRTRLFRHVLLALRFLLRVRFKQRRTAVRSLRDKSNACHVTVRQ